MAVGGASEAPGRCVPDPAAVDNAVGDGGVAPSVVVGLAPIGAPALDVPPGVDDPAWGAWEDGRVMTNNVAAASMAAARPTLSQSRGSLKSASAWRRAEPEAGKHVRGTPSA